MIKVLKSTNRILSSAASTSSATALKMSCAVKYEEAIRLLNSLQSNAATIKLLREQRERLQLNNVANGRKVLESMGISMKDIDKLNIIHVSGTKGKGSTCAFVEKILRDAGLRTGLYTSPHLIHVTERIRINGQPIDEKTFAIELVDTYNHLKLHHSDEMPAYFKFLTLLAFRIFLKSNLDVVILEVGIGGEYDCTNVVQNPKVCGISTLDYDHISLLGHKLTEIAWHKAGIMKRNCPAIYSKTSEEAEKVIQDRANSKNVEAVVAPPFLSYSWPRQISVGIAGEHQQHNVSLALQLAFAWAKQTDFPLAGLRSDWKLGQSFKVPQSICKSIEECRWDGRSQILKTDRGITYLVDGAHTPKSMEACALWAKEELKKYGKNTKKVLIFQCTADRCPSTLLPFLKNLNINQIVSCTTQLYPQLNQASDSTNLNSSKSEQIEKSQKSVLAWKEMHGSTENISDDQLKVFDCISSAIDFVENEAKNQELCVLVTGSLHLVGGVINLVRKRI